MMLRNPEIKKFMIIQLLVCLVFVLISSLMNAVAGWMVLIVTIILNALFFGFTFLRYRKIKELVMYINRISNGEFRLDVRDNKEGELSILKNEIYKVTEKLTEYNQRLQQEKLYLSQSLADISHQLKTPLTSMIIRCEILNDPDLPQDKRKEFVSQIIVQLERIDWLVSTMLKMSRLDAGVVTMKKMDIYVSDLVEKAKSALIAPMESKEIELVTQFASEDKLKCDFNWTCEAVINILKNCIEHTPQKGRIEIDYSDNPLYHELTIKDNGAGISKKDLPHIFTRFYRGENASAESTGIGLAMAKSIINAQHGNIIVESQKNKGCKFMIRLYKTVV
ncbi:MAG TPA: HAMP domain-containing sensor histidine kinase [Clostridia bacterium]|nr:HAMP domain-containing sensor histidine kinase [Clostridia bacterium]HPZ52562.1 HAMP domain-containing sensor histidine kinase [Clostridia bacterium]